MTHEEVIVKLNLYIKRFKNVKQTAASMKVNYTSLLRARNTKIPIHNKILKVLGLKKVRHVTYTYEEL
jgi:hypothetical protein